MLNFSTKHLDQLTLEAKFSFKPTSSSLYGALGDHLPANTTVLATFALPLQPPAPAQHHGPPASPGAVNPPTAGAAPSASPTATQPDRHHQTTAGATARLPTPTPPRLQPPVPAQHHAPPTSTTTCTVNQPEDLPPHHTVPSHPSTGRPRQAAASNSFASARGEKTTTIDLNQGHAHPRSSLNTVSQEKSRQETGRRKSTSVREYCAGSGNSRYRKIAPKPDHRRKEKEETEKTGSLSAGAGANRRFRIILPSSQMVGELKREEGRGKKWIGDGSLSSSR